MSNDVGEIKNGHHCLRHGRRCAVVVRWDAMRTRTRLREEVRAERGASAGEEDTSHAGLLRGPKAELLETDTASREVNRTCVDEKWAIADVVGPCICGQERGH